jgi:hypothetical protein
MLPGKSQSQGEVQLQKEQPLAVAPVMQLTPNAGIGVT